MTDYVLIDGEEMNAAHPESFEIPDAIIRHNLKVGDVAKLGFLIGDLGERMWVRVTVASPNGRYVGSLANEPVTNELPISFGSLIEFEPRHVLTIEEAVSE